MSWHQPQPQQAPDHAAVPAPSPWADDTELSSPFMRRLLEKPYQMAGGLAACVVAVFVLSKFVTFSNEHQTKEAEAAIAAASGGQTGQAWTAPAAYTPPPAAPKAEPQPQQQPPQARPQSGSTGAPAGAANSNPTWHTVFAGNGTAGTSGEQRPTLARDDADDTALGGLLKPTALSGYRATRMRHPGTTIEQGRVIACKTVQPMTSQMPGFITAKLAGDVWSYDNTRRLLLDSSTVFGEIDHGLIAGQDRLFVLWRQVTEPPPAGVRITLNSPAADELGESGLPGDVDHHTWQKIGGALLLSGIETALSGVGAGLNAAIQGHNNDNNGINNNGLGGVNFYQFQGQGNSLASQLLAHTITIPDTLHRSQALPCSIFVSGDLDFYDVYKLQRDAP